MQPMPLLTEGMYWTGTNIDVFQYHRKEHLVYCRFTIDLTSYRGSTKSKAFFMFQ